MPNREIQNVADLSARIRELQTELQRTVTDLEGAAAHTNCSTACGIEALEAIQLPGEARALSGAELLARLQQ